jgi:hypothetical protein
MAFVMIRQVVDAPRDELVALADLQAHRPVLSQIRVGPPEDQKSQ